MSRQQCCGVSFAIVGMLLSAALVVAAPVNEPWTTNKFIFLSNERSGALQLLECPNHLYGTPEAGEQALRERIRENGEKPRFIQLCIRDQVESLTRYGPLVDFAALNPYVTGSAEAPTRGERIWPGVDHPLINRLRELRRAAGGVPLLARIDLLGKDGGYFLKRPPTFHELEWLSYAAIGAGFRGIIWVGADGFGTRARRLRAWESVLDPQRDALWSGSLIDSVIESSGPVSTIAFEDRLIVVLLNSHYVRPLRDEAGMVLPLDRPRQETTCRIRLPAGRTLRRASTIAGTPVPVTTERESLVISHAFSGGGDMLVLSLDAKPPAPSPALEAKETP